MRQSLAPRNENGAHPCAPCVSSEREAPAGRAMAIAAPRSAVDRAQAPGTVGLRQGGHAFRAGSCVAAGTGRLRGYGGSRRGYRGSPCGWADVMHETTPRIFGTNGPDAAEGPVAMTCRTPVRRRFLLARRFPSARCGRRPPERFPLAVGLGALLDDTRPRRCRPEPFADPPHGESVETKQSNLHSSISKSTNAYRQHTNHLHKLHIGFDRMKKRKRIAIRFDMSTQ